MSTDAPSSSTTETTAAAAAAPAATSSSLFGTSVPTFSFGSGSSSFAAAVAAESSSSSGAAAASTEGEDGNDGEVEGADSTAEYAPVVKLTEVRVASGEEDDEEIYRQRSALYRFDAKSNEWKERGKGDVKLLKSKTTGLIRILLRQDKTLKCCINHMVLPVLELKPNVGSDRSWTWRCRDYSGETPEDTTFAIRFKDADIANVFLTKFNEARESNRSKQGTAASSSESAAPSS